MRLAKKETLVPVCPEQLGGFATPRERAERRGEKVLTESGKDVTVNFRRGAEEVLRIAKLLGVREAVLKQRSPSCGSGQLKMMSGEIFAGDGITAGLLKKNGIRVISEEEL